MLVKLLTYTPEPDKLVAAAAKLCYSDAHIETIMDGLTPEKTDAFLKKLSSMGHQSPTEHAYFTFGIEGVSRTLLAQITRHRIASFSVQSQRYVRLDDFRYVIPPVIENDTEAKATFIEAMNRDAENYLKEVERLEVIHTKVLMENGASEKDAKRMASKFANEDARFLLPNACETKMVVTMNARSLHNFFAMRCYNRAQWEILKSTLCFLFSSAIDWEVYMDNTIVSPAEYFEQVKSRKQTMTAAGLSQLYENCLALLEEYQRSGQIAAQKKLLFHIDNITREKKLLDLGIDTFVYKSDVDDFIHMVDNKVVKIVELENYQRRIPEEIIQRIERCKGIFDKMYVVFTDYTKREERRVEAIKREKDPILFGTFQDTVTRTVVERFYFIGDWTDEYCDLTLDKMVAVVKEKADRDIVKKFSTPESIRELSDQLNNLDESMNGLYRQREKAPAPKKGFFDRVRTAFRSPKGE